jgi:hypothetical protein
MGAEFSDSAPPSYAKGAAEIAERSTICIPIPTGAASRIVIGRPCILVGCKFVETAGAVATFDLLNGSDGNGELLFPMSFAAKGESVLDLSADGPYCPGGIYLLRAAGTVKGAVYVKA